MIQESIDRLKYLVNTTPSLLKEISEEVMSRKPLPEKWSKKEILGHLIDSATNNHQRFVRAQFQIEPEIAYDQDRWNEINQYQKIESEQLITFWTAYNKHIIEIVQRIESNNLSRKVKIGDSLFTLEFIIIDYVKHLEHHLMQLIEY